MQLLIRSLCLCLLTVGTATAADVYRFDPVHTQVTFHINHMGFSNSSGLFHVADGAFQFDEHDWAKASVHATIDLDSLDMGNATWKEHVLGEQLLDAAKYPTMRFVSTKVERVDAHRLWITGELTLHGVTKPVVLDTTINKIGKHPLLGRPAAGFSATAQLKRSDFGITQWLPMVGDEVTLRIEVEGNVPATP